MCVLCWQGCVRHQRHQHQTSNAGFDCMTNNNLASDRVWCSIHQMWNVFPKRVAWMAEPCRAIAQQLGFPIRDVYRAAMVGAHIGHEAIPEAEIIWEEHSDALHDRVRLRGKLSITELLDISR